MAHQSKYPSLDRQWHKMMFSFFEYLPMQYRQATEREWQIRKMIWNFKDGKSYLNVTITKPLLFSEKAPTMKREPFSSR